MSAPAEMERPTQITELSCGPVEYRLERRGPRTVLMMHGGHMRASLPLGEEVFADAGYTILAPSRPGYGRTPLTTGTTPAGFADAVADLCDRLGIDSLATATGDGQPGRREPRQPWMPGDIGGRSVRSPAARLLGGGGEGEAGTWQKPWVSLWLLLHNRKPVGRTRNGLSGLGSRRGWKGELMGDADFSPWPHFGAELRRWREAREMSVTELAASIPLNYSSISRWEHGRRPVPADQARRLDDALGADGHLVALHAMACEVDNRTGRAQAAASLSEDDMERRRLMQDAAAVAAAGATAPLLTVLTSAWENSGPRICGASVSQEMIDDWEEAADVHSRRGYLDSPAAVLAGLAADFTAMAPHLNRAQPGPVQRDLAHAAARHAALIAGKWFDLGNRREAHRWWSKTRTLSERSEDTSLAALLMAWEVAYRRQDPDENLDDVLRVAQRARRLAGEGPSAALVVALGAEAQALAMSGRHDQAVAALRRTESTLDRLPASVVHESLPRGVCYDRVLIHTLAGDLRQAGEAVSVAEKLYPAQHRTAVIIALHNAALHARTDPEQSAQQASCRVEALPGERRCLRVKSAARIVLKLVPERAHALPAVQELHALTA